VHVENKTTFDEETKRSECHNIRSGVQGVLKFTKTLLNIVYHPGSFS